MPAKPTTRRTLLQPKTWTSALGASVAFARSEEGAAEENLIRAGRPAMASQFEIFFPASQRAKIEAVHDALDEVQRLECQMSVFREDSEICGINHRAAKEPVEVETRLFELLRLGLDLYEQTQGAFDITAGPLSRCWGFSRRQGRVPQQEEIEEALARVGSDFLQLDPAARSVFFQRGKLEINLGSIGKGYALDRAAEILKKANLNRALLHAGYSSLLAMGNAIGDGSETGWPLSIRHPVEQNRDFSLVRLCDRGMSTSGVGEQYFTSEGKRYGHIIDPRTGHPSDVNFSATALANSAAEADALSTAFFVMCVEEVEEYCRKYPQVGALVVPNRGEPDRLECHTFGAVPDDLEVAL